MKRIKRGELYRHVSDFLKKKGVELHKGPYPGRLEQACRLLTDTINATQSTLDRARDGMDRGLKQVRQALKRERKGVSPKASPFAAPTEPISPKPKPKPRTRSARVASTARRKRAPRAKAGRA